MNNKIYCSTGTMIGRVNNYDYRLAVKNAPNLDADGLELMMLKAYYDKYDAIAGDFKAVGVKLPVIHSDKDIGTLISSGKPEDTAEGLRLFESNCLLGSKINAGKIVLHLWGGYDSDSRFDYNAEVCEKILNTAHNYGLTLVIENIPCTTVDPLTHWKQLAEMYPQARFIFDTRFGGFHEQLTQVFDDGWFGSGKVLHMHISDFTGPAGDFRTLRPILHPHEGIIDFETFFSRVKPIYHNSITLESPVMSESGIDTVKLNNTLNYIRKQVN